MTPSGRGISGWLSLLLAVACGAIVANLYYAQPLIALIGPGVGLSPGAASLIVTLTQLGYVVGLVFLVPLGDIVENRRLIFCTMAVAIVALACSAGAPFAAAFLAAAVLVGIGSATAQMLIALTAHLAPDATRGRVVGNVMSGLVTGILLSRPVGSMIADLAGWRVVFAAAAGLNVLLLGLLLRFLPVRHPGPGLGYRHLISSLPALLAGTPVLQRRSFYQATLFAAFTLFWTTVPLQLAGPDFGFSQKGIALFALAGAAGALAAPLAGRMADRGWGRAATGLALASVSAAFLVAKIAGGGSLAALVVAALLLDFAVQTNLVVGQRAIYSLPAALRSRLTGLHLSLLFVGGAIGSASASPAFTGGGWSLVTWIGFLFPVLALLAYATEFRRRPGS